jgi:histidinol dehydrogenase
MKIIGENELDGLLKRSQFNNEELNIKVKEIVNDVRLNGDSAIFKYSKQFDNTDFAKVSLTVTDDEIAQAYKKVRKSLLVSLKKAINNVLEYHKRNILKQNTKTKNERTTGYIVRAVDRAGIYVPGGTAAYPSSVIMGVLPAVAAGVKDISVVTPAKNGKINPLTIVAAVECGANRIYKIGGAQAVAALAFGTENINKVDIIAGPGNIFVTLAKKEVYGYVGIDMLAGPSEILIICDSSAKAEYVAADMLSQAEHDVLATAIVITDNKILAEQIEKEVEIQLNKLPRFEIAKNSLESNGAIVVVSNLEKGIELANRLAPEHLELCVAEPYKLLDKVQNAGAVFLGNYTPEAVGDYFAGPDHILPTSGTAKFFQVLNQDIFLKKISVINYSEKALKKDGKHIIRLAESEGLKAHANSIKVRIEKEEK